MKHPTFKTEVKWKKNLPYYLAYSILFLTTLPIILMYLWLLLSSISERMMYGVIPVGLTLENWSFLWGEIQVGSAQLPSIWRATWNSFLFSIVLTLLEVSVGVMAGYAVSRIEFPGRSSLLKVTLLLHAFPGVALIVAIFFVLNSMGLYNNLLGVILVKVSLQVPMTVWIIKGFFDDVSWDIEWAGLIDGASRIKIFFVIMLPLVKPGIAAVSIFSFLSGWSEFLLLYTFVHSSGQMTLSSYLSRLLGDPTAINYGYVSAVSLFYMIPVIIFFLFTQKQLMQVSIGGGKRV